MNVLSSLRDSLLGKPSPVFAEVSEDARLIDLTKKASVTLEKKRLLVDKASVALCLDISGSMSTLYRNGSIDALVQRVLALGLNLDRDSKIDVFLFGERSHNYGEVDALNYRRFTRDMLGRFNLESDTLYARAIAKIASYYEWKCENGKLPVYVMFVTDGDANDAHDAQEIVKAVSSRPIFWQFMAIGSRPEHFGLLNRLDTMPGRVVDNAGFFTVSDPSSISDEDLYEKMLSEYPQWQRAAVQANILKVNA